MSLYPLNAAHVPLLGRGAIVDRLLKKIVRGDPLNVSVIGPPYIGKTTLLSHIGEMFQAPERTEYVTACYLDLRHHTPTTDNDCRRRLAEELVAALKPIDAEVASLIEVDGDAEDLAMQLPGVFEFGPFLVILDGLDHVLEQQTISRNLWDYLRDIAQHKGCTMVTGSRAPLQELCRNPESHTSQFWNVFDDPPLWLGAFDDADWDDVLAPLVSITTEIEVPGRKEIINWTGGHPALVAQLLGQVGERHEGKSITKDLIDTAALELVGSSQQLRQLWEGLSAEVRADLHNLATNATGSHHISADRMREITTRGFVDAAGKQPRVKCRMIGEIAKAQSETKDVRRLFGSADNYAANIQGVLELRLEQVPGGPGRIKKDVAYAIQDLHDPVRCIRGFRGIADQALDRVWNQECPGRKIPGDMRTKLEGQNSRFAGAEVPRNRGSQMGLLRDITGEERIAQFVSRSTANALGHIKNLGDLGNHLDGGEVITHGFAVSACLVAIELLECLQRDLP